MMILPSVLPTNSTYRVEVSGWDVTHSFFVEASELEWSEEIGKQVVLSHAVQDGAILFVRLLQATASEQSWPVPYEAQYLARTPEGYHQFRLKQIQSRFV
jgi:hypothetical protein